MRCSEPRSGFVPDNRPAEGEWYWIDAPGIAQSLQLPADVPLVEVGSCCCSRLAAFHFAAMVIDTVFVEKEVATHTRAYRASSRCLPLHQPWMQPMSGRSLVPRIGCHVICRL